jgi:hypothetical protein
LLQCSITHPAPQAYFYDAALTFGRAAYMGTGRDFVLRHLGFDEVWRATAHSHLYPGMEALTLLALTTIYGTFQSVTAYLFFFISGWLLSMSLLFGAFWFNPFALEWKYVRADWREWWAWLLRDGEGVIGGSGVTPESSWGAWYAKETGSQYAAANLGARLWRAARLSRLLLLGCLLAFRMAAAVGNETLYFVLFAGLGLGGVLGMQLAHIISLPFPRRKDSTARSLLCPVHHPVRRVLQVAVYGALVAGVIVLASLSPKASFIDYVTGYVAFNVFACVWHKIFDVKISLILFAVQAFCALMLPLGSVVSGGRCETGDHAAPAACKSPAVFSRRCSPRSSCVPPRAPCTLVTRRRLQLHTYLLFSSEFADTVEVITGARNVLDRHSKHAGAKFLKVRSCVVRASRAPWHWAEARP